MINSEYVYLWYIPQDLGVQWRIKSDTEGIAYSSQHVANHKLRDSYLQISQTNLKDFIWLTSRVFHFNLLKWNTLLTIYNNLNQKPSNTLPINFINHETNFNFKISLCKPMEIKT